MNFNAFIEDIKKNQWNIYGVEVYEDGKLLHQYGDTIETRYPIYSATKTITSIAVGMSVDEGKLELNKSILEYLPTNIVANLSNQQLEAYKSITTKRLLTMSVSGYPFRPGGESWLMEALTYPIENENWTNSGGTSANSVNQFDFHYSNVSAYLAGVVATNAVGEDLYQYLNRKLFSPLGIINPPYERCPDGYFYGASKMELTVHELSKIGLLLYHGGIYEKEDVTGIHAGKSANTVSQGILDERNLDAVYQRKRILSEDYVRQMTATQIENKDGGYGYFVWKYRDGFYISGKWQQRCYVLPKEKRVVTFLSHIEKEEQNMIESVERNLLT